MTGAVVFFLLFWCGVGGGVAFAIGNSKGRGPEGIFFGLRLGLL